MTQNQLKYWELRWKQYYDTLTLAETKRANIARESETERHNRKEERIATQQLVLKRIELSQKQEQINQQWAQIELGERKLFIETTLENAKIMQKNQELEIKDREVQIKAEELLSHNTLAVADLILEYSNESTKRQTERFSAYVDALSKGWTKAAAAKAIQELENNDNTSKALKDVLKNMADKYKLEIEIEGPNSIGKQVKDWADTSINKSLEQTSEHGGLGVYTKPDGSKYHDPTGKRELVEKYGPALKAAQGYGGDTSVKGNSDNKNLGVTESGPGVGLSDRNFGNDTPGVIYSGGSQTGPGWR